MLAQVAHGKAWDVPERCAGERCRVPGVRGGCWLCSGLVDAGLQDARVPWVRALPRQKSRKGLVHVHKTSAIPAGSKGNVLTQQDEAGPRAAAPQMQFGCHHSAPSSSVVLLREELPRQKGR